MEAPLTTRCSGEGQSSGATTEFPWAAMVSHTASWLAFVYHRGLSRGQQVRPVMMAMTLPARSPVDHPLIVADQQLAEAEQRRDQQIRIVAGLVEGTEARTYAEHVLQVMERNILMSRAHQSLIQSLLQDEGDVAA